MKMMTMVLVGTEVKKVVEVTCLSLASSGSLQLSLWKNEKTKLNNPIPFVV